MAKLTKIGDKQEEQQDQQEGMSDPEPISVPAPSPAPEPKPMSDEVAKASKYIKDALAEIRAKEATVYTKQVVAKLEAVLVLLRVGT